MSFVQDARLLFGQLSPATGAQIIFKYSGRNPAPRLRVRRPWAKKPKQGAAANAAPALNTGKLPFRPTSPLASAASYVRRQGIDILLQDAAKAVYQRGEKWGVNQAVRDAMDEVRKNVQGLQSGSASPLLLPPPSSGALSKIANEGDNDRAARFLAALETLQQRNKELALTLQDARE